MSFFSGPGIRVQLLSVRPAPQALKDIVFRLHVRTGVISACAGLYYLAKRRRSLLPRA